jgi:hypothetical protein
MAVKITFKSLSERVAKTDLVVVLAPEGGKPKLPEGVTVPPNVPASFRGNAREARLTDATAGAAARELFIGLGGAKELDLETVRRGACRIPRRTGCDRATWWKRRGKSRAFPRGSRCG